MVGWKGGRVDMKEGGGRLCGCSMDNLGERCTRVRRRGGELGVLVCEATCVGAHLGLGLFRLEWVLQS
jgi:hypothetical protein